MSSRPGVIQTYEPVEGHRCPHCGGSTGFQYTWTARFTTFFSWKGMLEDTNEPTPLRTNLLRCSDCRKPVEDLVTPIGELE